MIQYAAILLSAIAIVLFVTPFVRNAATRFGVTDTPSARKVHASPVPLLGGLAIWIGFVLTLLVFDPADFVQQFGSIIAGATLASIVGLWDDRWGMKPIFKLFGQIVAAGLMVAFGTSVHFLHNDLLNMAATILWVVGITNALNLMDNMDGLAGGVAAVASVFFFLIATLTNQNLIAPLSAVLLGGCIGFLYYNFKPGAIFMGDTGSLLLGFILAAVGIKLRFPDSIAGDRVTWMVPLLVLGVPLFDTTLVTLSRIRRGIPISRGGKDHFSHRLVALGYTKREAVLILYLVQAGLGVAALVVMQADMVVGYATGFVVLVCAIVTAYKLEQLDLTETNPAPPGAPPVISLRQRLDRTSRHGP
jgi:UDP-GlcNAc:undecaprenyl-phosphate GlcNAc-1-phosphate transferase